MYSMAVRTCPVNPREHKFAVIADLQVGNTVHRYGLTVIPCNYEEQSMDDIKWT